MDYSIEANWQEPEPGTREYVRKGDGRQLAFTQHCPCDLCPQYAGCIVTGYECPTFQHWCETGK